MKNLIQISKYAGMREDLVQAGGGNSSVKLSNEKMLIKASGYQLADVTESEGYAVVNPSVIIDFFEHTSLDFIEKKDEKALLDRAFIEGKRPSIETFLHSITDKVTLHTHAFLVNVLATRKGGMEVLKELFPEALFVPYATPGIELAKEYFRAYQQNGKKKTDIIFLQNHGLIVSAETADEVIDKTEEVLEKIAKYLQIDYEKYAKNTRLYQLLTVVGLEDDIVYQAQNRKIYEAYEKFGKRVWNHEICPDCVVYCGRKFMVIGDENNIEKFLHQYGKPVVIVWKDEFYIVSSSVKKAKEIECMVAFSAEIAMANMNQEMDYLSDKEQEFLLNWDAEKYRKNMK